MVFDLMEAVMAGRAADALAITDRAHNFGADLGALLGDLLELTHTLSRLKTVPDLRLSQELPEAERTRGAALADALSVPALARAWQMLLKGTAEIESAGDRRAAVDMVLIRLCYVADLPPPGDLVRRLQAAPPSGGGAPSAGPPSGGGMRAVAGGAPVHMQAPAPAAAPRLAGFRDVLALVAAEREMLLHGHLLHSVHLVRFAPPVIELRPQPDAPRDLAPKLAALLLRVTGTRWTIAFSAEAGEATLAQQGNDADRARRDGAAAHPLVRAILEAFPGAVIDAVRAPGVDAYGLPEDTGAPEISLGEPDMPDFAPPDAEPADVMEME
jgi:DNA polymerase-3 subunit gamma/tau